MANDPNENHGAHHGDAKTTSEVKRALPVRPSGLNPIVSLVIGLIFIVIGLAMLGAF